jgi:hypothetical protein
MPALYAICRFCENHIIILCTDEYNSQHTWFQALFLKICLVERAKSWTAHDDGE